MFSLLFQLSKYLIAIFMMVFSILSILVFAIKNKTARSVISGIQATLNLFVAGLGLMDLYIVYKKPMYLAVCLFVVVSIFLLLVLTTLIYREADRIILNNMSILFTIGLITISRISINKATKQYIIFMFCFAICMVLPYVFEKLKKLKDIKWIYCGVGLAMIMVVMILGEATHGSKLSFTLFNITFQPSEFVKILFVFFVAASLWKDNTFKNILITSAISASYVVILVISKDLGTALIFFITYVFMLVIASSNYLYLLGGTGLLAVSSVLAYKIFSHVRTRVVVWKDPWTYIDSKGYQITQGLFALSSGGAFGTGLTKGSPTDIPYVETDFIFSAICEEMGIIVGISLLFISISSFIEMIRISSKIVDRFYSLLVYGIAVSMTFQVFLTVGGGTKFIPLTGVTLPLVSYGGTSIMVTMIMYFIVQSIYIRLRRADKNISTKPYRFHKEVALNEKE